MPRHTAPSHVIDDMPCAGCGYNLRTLDLVGDCPECGHSIALTHTWHTSLPDPAWMRRERRGVSLILIGSGLLLLFYIVAAVAGALELSILLEVFLLVGVVGLPQVVFVGLWIVAGPDPNMSPIDRPWIAYWIARAAIPVWALMWVLTLLFPRTIWGMRNIEWQFIFLTALWLSSGLSMFGLGVCLRAACKRVDTRPKSLRLDMYCSILGVFLLLLGLMLLSRLIGLSLIPASLFVVCLIVMACIAGLMLIAFFRLRVALACDTPLQ